MKRFISLLLLILTAALLVGCAAETSTIPPEYRWASVMGSKLSEKAAGKNLNFGIHVDQAMVESHILSNVLLFYGVAKAQSRWLWVSFAYKSGVDAIAGFAQMWGVAQLSHLWLIEGFVILFGLVGMWGIRRVALHYPLEVT
jgi:hypothetical protein